MTIYAALIISVRKKNLLLILSEISADRRAYAADFF